MTKGRVTLDILCRDHPRENRHYSILQMPLFLIGDVRYTDLVFGALPTRLETLSLIWIGMLGTTEKQLESDVIDTPSTFMSHTCASYRTIVIPKIRRC